MRRAIDVPKAVSPNDLYTACESALRNFFVSPGKNGRGRTDARHLAVLTVNVPVGDDLCKKKRTLALTRGAVLGRPVGPRTHILACTN